MKALVLEKYNKLVYRDFPDPGLGEEEVLIRVKACGICGSDVHGMDGSTGRRIPPLIMGHEASGTIEKTGNRVKGWKAGDRVTFDSTIYPLNDWYTLKGQYNLSNNRQVVGVSPGDYRKHGAFAEFVTVPQHILYRIPDTVSFEEAAMAEPVAVAAHSVKLAGIKPGDSAVVVGAGMVGTFVIQLLKIAGADPVVALDTDEIKQELAEKAGADFIFNPLKKDVANKIKELTNQRGADFGFEVVGKSESVNTCIETVRKGGTVLLVGNLAPEVQFPLQKVVTQELKVQGSCAINGEYEMVLHLIASGKINTDLILSAVAPLSEGADWFKKLYRKKPGLNKVILVPDDEFRPES